MKILVTGGAGFIASHIVDRYIELGHNVVVVDNLYTGKRENINPAARFYEVDIRDKDAIREIFRTERPEIVNHHAAQMDVRVSVERPDFDNAVNLQGLINLLQSSMEVGTKKFIFASSGGVVYGDTPYLPCTEELPKKPESPYGVSKWASELYLYYYHKVHGLKYVALRYSNVYGPRQEGGEAGVIAIFIRRLLQKKVCHIYGDGNQLRDYIYVSDVVEANVKALESDLNDGVNIGTGVPTSVNELYELLRAELGLDMKPEYKPPRPGELYKNYLDNSRAYKVMGWYPRISLKEGLRKTIEFFKEEMQ